MFLLPQGSEEHPEVRRRHRVAQARHHEVPFRGWEVEGQKDEA